MKKWLKSRCGQESDQPLANRSCGVKTKRSSAVEDPLAWKPAKKEKGSSEKTLGT